MMDSSVVEACPGLLVDLWGSYFSLHVLCSPLGGKKKGIDVIQLSNRKNKTAAEFCHVSRLHWMCNSRNVEDIYYVAAVLIFQSFVSWSTFYRMLYPCFAPYFCH